MLKKVFILFLASLVISIQMTSAFAAKSHTRKKQRHYYTNYKAISKKAASGYNVNGVASWYGKQFQHKRTSSGERYNMYQLTAAHKTLPLNSIVKVTNLKNGKNVIVKINDRGPYIGNRSIDLSYAAAQKIGMVNRGLAPVNIKVIKV